MDIIVAKNPSVWHDERLEDLDEAIKNICREELGLIVSRVEFDIVPPQKMLEIMAYFYPTQISNWKFGRNYERLRTMFEKGAQTLPYEVVCYGNPHRAFLMNTNKIACHIMTIAHVYGHCHFYHANRFLQLAPCDTLADVLSSANQRFQAYEAAYGIDAVEKVVDLAHALSYNVDVDRTETEQELKEKIFTKYLERKKERRGNNHNSSMFSDLISPTSENNIILTDDQFRDVLRNKNPIRPTQDILRVIIDYCNLPDWVNDILETIRIYNRTIKPRYLVHFMNEGFATYIHTKVMNRLYDLDLISTEEYGDYIYHDSLVRSRSRLKLNPYNVACNMFFDIEDRWNKGRYGDEYNECQKQKEKDTWNRPPSAFPLCSSSSGDKENVELSPGIRKVLEVVEVMNDWSFMYEFLTEDFIKKQGIYLYERQDIDNYPGLEGFVVKDTNPSKLRKLILKSWIYPSLPTIEVQSCYSGRIRLSCKYDGRELDKEYTEKVLEMIASVTNYSVSLCYEGETNEVPISTFEVNPKKLEEGI